MANGLVHFAAVPKAHLDLGGVYVHVDAQRVDLDIQRIHRLLLAMQHVFIGAARGMGDHLVAHEAPIDVAKLLVGARARGVGQARTTGDQQVAVAVIDGDRFIHEVGVEHVAESALDGFLQLVGIAQIGRVHRGSPLLDQFAFVPDRKAHIGPRECVAANGLDTVREFGRIGLQKLAARGCGEKQFLHFHRRAAAARCGAQFAAAGIEQKGAGLVCGAGEQGGLGHRGDGGQRLAPKAHGVDRFQIVQIGDLAGGVAAQGDRQLLGRNARTVVFHRNQAHTAREQAHGDLRGARIERVVDQFAHGGSGALHHLTGRNLTDQLVRQIANRAALSGSGGGGGGGCFVHRIILKAACPEWMA